MSWKAFICLAVLLFIAYCVSAHRHQYRVAVPEYATGEVELLAAGDAGRWEDRDFRSSRLAALTGKRYQAPAGGLALPGGETLPAGAVLRNEHYTAIVAAAIADGTAARAKLADPRRVLALQGQDYTFRDPVKDAEGGYLFRGGEAIDQAAIDKLLAAGVREIGVQGSPSPVRVESGTLLAVLVIFLALVGALKLTLVDPLVSIIERRRQETDAGADLAKQNVRAQENLRKERDDRLREVARERLARMQDGRAASLKESEAIIHLAKEEERRLRQEMHQELHGIMEEAHRQAMESARALGRQAVEQVLGRSI